MPIFFTDRRFGLRITTKDAAGARILPESGTGIGILAVDKADSQPSMLHYCGTGTDSPLMCAEDLENSLMCHRVWRENNTVDP